MLNVTEEIILEVYRESLNNIKVEFLHTAHDKNIDLYDEKTDVSLFFLQLREKHRSLRFAGSFDEFANWREEVERYRAVLAKFEEHGHI